MQKTKFKYEDLANMLSKDKLIIFLFHGVINKHKDSVRNYTSKHLEKDFFANAIKLLSKKGNSLSMDDVKNHIENKMRFPKYSYSITFDDGFENNISIAAPILYEYKTFATIYITTKFVENNLMSWIDRIENAVQNYSEVKFNWFGDNFSFNTTEKKINFLEKIRYVVKNDFTINPDEYADKICFKLGESIYSQDNHLDLKMNWNQVKSANNSEYLSIGGHSHSHKILSFLSKNDLKEEINLSIDLLKSKANINPIHYSYPEGMANCFNENVINELKMRGIKCCPTAIRGYNRNDTSLFHLNRVQVF